MTSPALKWKAAGRSTAITESVNSEEFNCVEPVKGRSGLRARGFFGYACHSLTPNPCSEKRVPPAKKHIPRTSTTRNGRVRKGVCT